MSANTTATKTKQQRLEAALPHFREAGRLITELWDALGAIEKEMGQDYCDMSVEMFGLADCDPDELGIEDLKDYLEGCGPDGPPHDEAVA